MLETAMRAAREAGRLLLEASAKEIEVDRRDRRDVKLAMDRTAEAKIIEVLREAFPDHAVLSEEAGRIAGDSEYLWVIDPLDGTFNYSRRVPVWCTSIGLLKGSEEVVGAIYDPTRDEMFSAERGSGAFLNGERVRVSDTDSLEYATINYSSSTDATDIERTMRAALHLATRAGKVRALGAAATHVAYVAAGRMDAFYDYGAKLWDVAAGLVILREAGGMVARRNTSDTTLDLAVSNGRFHDELLTAIGWDQ